MYNDTAAAFGVLGIIMIVIIVLIIVFLIPYIFYLLTLQNTLKAVAVHNRQMSPGQVWLNLIPLFGMVWHFIVVDKMSQSLKLEFAERNIPCEEEKPAYNLGLTMCILNACTVVPILGSLAALGGLVVWIVYWVKIADYKKRLETVVAF